MGGSVNLGTRTRVAVVGYGYWGSKHVRVLSSLSDVEVTVVDPNDARRAEAEGTYSWARAVPRLDQALDRVDAVVVATPPAAHVPVALQALRAGKHVLVEKPLATSVPDARLMVDVATACDVQLMVGHTFQYNAAVRMLKRIIDSGELGRILYVDCARLSLGRYQRDCNVIWDLAPHDISIVSYLLDEVPQSVSVWAHRHVGSRHADVAYLRMGLERARTNAFVHVSWLDPSKLRRVTVVGERKMVVYDDISDERIRIFDIGVDPMEGDEHGEPHAMPVSYRTGDIVSPFVQFSEPLLVQDSHFVDCVRTGRRTETPGEQGLDVVRVLSATDLAHGVGGGPVSVGGVDPPATSLVPSEVAS